MAAPQLHPVSRIDDAIAHGSDWDAVVVVTPNPSEVPWPSIAAAAQALGEIDQSSTDQVTLTVDKTFAGGRLVFAPTGSLRRDHDDVRMVGDAAKAGVLRASQAGARRPLLLMAGIPSDADYAHALEVSLLACCQGLWQPLEGREALGETDIEPVEQIGFGVSDAGHGETVAKLCNAAELGRRLARDLGGTEPERMAAPRFAEYCQQAFAGTAVQVSVIDDVATLQKDYPLLSAVARCSLVVERHQPRVIRLEYRGEGPVQKTLLFAGKGLTYDTGGADIKAGGHMAGMSRDKGGGAAVAGFMRSVAELQPKHLHVIAEIGAVRNSVGADAFVSDEIITGHAGVRVRIGNTDAEGRLVLADLLSHLREDATQATDPHMFSIATLTGHAARAVGPYTISLDNGPAFANDISKTFSRLGDLWGDPFDTSRLRREDYDFVRPRSKADDVLSCNNAPSSATARGHQFPMAFLAIASGLDQHGRHDDQPLGYTHIDVAGSAAENGDWQHGKPTGAPIVALIKSLLE